MAVHEHQGRQRAGAAATAVCTDKESDAPKSRNEHSGRKSRMEQAGKRIYVCHTFYHVYVACLKELNLRHGSSSKKAEVRADGKGHTTVDHQDGATLMLSLMSTDFGDLESRARESGIFEDVIIFEEKDYTYFPELVELKKDRGSLAANMFQRMKFCRRMGELEEPFVPVDFHQYQDIYVFCDSDPIGYYLSWKKIYYHAVEDGLNCLRYRDTAREDNRGAFRVKAWMARRGLIFMQNGYGRYCLDMEVNDISVLDHPISKMVEQNRENLVNGLDEADRKKLVRLFIANEKELMDTLAKAQGQHHPIVLILTEPLCKDLTVRRQLFADMIDQYGTFETKEGRIKGTIVIKPHPRDKLDYHKAFPHDLILDAHFPMEILNFTGAQFDRVVTVYTVPSSIHCAKEKIYLGNAWMDKYEDSSAHQDVHNAEAAVTR